MNNLGTQIESSQKDGDGYVEVLSKDFQKARKFAVNLDAPKGLTIVDAVLYVSHIDGVIGFNLENGKKVFEFKIPNATF